MFFSSRSAASRSPPARERTPLPPRVAGLLREAWWWLLVAGAVYLTLILATYDKSDPGWSQSVAADAIHNAGGRFGAWLADLLLYLFGLSAYWCVLFLLLGTWWGYRRLDGSGDSDRRPFWIASIGFLALLLASACLEALRLHSLHVELPLAPGGMLGMARWARRSSASSASPAPRWPCCSSGA
jgi:DNA segregation ATPase FtsK/SpoIIIE, S-DNA-T family